MKSTLPRLVTHPVVISLVLATTFVVLVGDDAYAAADIKNAGKNAANVLKGYATALFGGITGVMAIVLLAQRKIGPALGFAGLALLVGWFVFDPASVGDAAKGISKTLLG